MRGEQLRGKEVAAQHAESLKSMLGDSDFHITLLSGEVYRHKDYVVAFFFYLCILAMSIKMRLPIVDIHHIKKVPFTNCRLTHGNAE